MLKALNLARFLLLMMNLEQGNITELLRELMEAKRLDAARLAYLTDVPQRFIGSLIAGDFKNLPSEPYIRGYLFKIAAVLDADPNALWLSFRQSAEIHSSGIADTLPINRFSLKKISGKKLWIGLAILVFLVFLGFRLNSILGKPTLEVSLPETTADKTIQISGRVTPGDTLTLNSEKLYPNPKGEFVKDVQLESGLNTLEFRVKRYLGRETTVVKQVFYQPTQ